MVFDNDYIAEQFSLLSKLMDIHGENSFKTKSYAIAAFTIERFPDQLSGIPSDKIFSIKGIGDAIGKKIIEIGETGELRLLKEYIQNTPPGVIEMLNIKGLGPKKIATVWKEMEIESVGELLYACNENRLLLYKGFGEKTQKNIKETIEFYLRNQGSYLYAEAEGFATAIDQKLKQNFPGEKFEATGEYRRQIEIINQLEWVTTVDPTNLLAFLEKEGYSTQPASEAGKIIFKGPENIALCFHLTDQTGFSGRLFKTSSGNEFLQAWELAFGEEESMIYPSEEEIFSSKNVNFIPSYLREKPSIIERAKQPLARTIQKEDIKGIIHSHSNWSDGSNSLEEMVRACIEKGYEYLVISDHSKSAFYANGLVEDRIKEQHQAIDELNTQFSPFKVFKGIECDILNDGNLDYSANILSTFDLVITSIHSNLKMSIDKAMLRLIGAIENPYTTILGHMTGRLLLSRPGYPVDHQKIIHACAANQVVIELNAHPRRLDIDWRWIEYALEKEVMISIDPDAHSIGGYKDIKYGVLVAQKAGITKESNLSSKTLLQLETFIKERKKVKGI